MHAAARLVQRERKVPPTAVVTPCVDKISRRIPRGQATMSESTPFYHLSGPRVSVRGTASRVVPPDMCSWSLTVAATADSRADSVAAVGRQRDLEAALTGLGGAPRCGGHDAARAHLVSPVHAHVRGARHRQDHRSAADQSTRCDPTVGWGLRSGSLIGAVAGGTFDAPASCVSSSNLAPPTVTNVGPAVAGRQTGWATLVSVGLAGEVLSQPGNT